MSTTQARSPYRKYPPCTSWFIPFPPNQSFTKQIVEVEPSKKNNETAAWGYFDMNSSIARRNLSKGFESGYQYSRQFTHPDFNSGYKKSHYSYPESDSTLHPADEESGSKPCLGHRLLLSLNPPVYAQQFEWMSYEDVDKKRRELGSALVWFFKRTKRDVINHSGDVRDEMGFEMDMVCIWANSSIEWQLVDLACQAYAKVITALYDSSSNDTVEYIINHAESRILFVTIDHLSTIFQLYPKLKHVQSVVLLHSDRDLAMYEAHGPMVKLAKSWAKSLGVDIWSLEECNVLIIPLKSILSSFFLVAEIGKQNLTQPIDVEPETGTTGQPKAAILTHGQTALTSATVVWGMQTAETGITMSALPLAHVYQRMINSTAFNQGGAVGFAQPNPLFLLEDMKLLKPTIIPAVPRLLNKIYQGVMAKFGGGGVISSLFNHAVKTKLEALRTDGRIEHPIWDKIIFNKIQLLLGGNLESVICGSAASSPDVLDFIQIAFKCRVYSETYAVGFRVLPKDPLGSFSVGTVFPCMETKLVDVEELGYFVRPRKEGERSRGELYVCTGPSGVGVRAEPVFSDPVSTKYTFGEDGWIHTGDIAEIDECGRFKIIDRKKNITKLSHGEFVALEKIESLYSASPIIAQLFVYGDSLRDYLVAIVVPIEGLHPESGSDLKTTILLALEEQAKNVGLKGYEKIRNIHITNELFSVEGGTLTPTLKIRRKDAYMMYKDVIEELYKMPVPSLTSGKVQGKL
ncbi:hypothetical protein Clacol_003324 [Clathrus columnatus]|uniref:AMP-dependent synthetase/ligase domain-containing protein n=1 Tax=Clathrus columnatus TaxID=1419009 RepID=A0AAV5A6H7_9AGAM|nr:hypothetical protein Clacol_003324 [Clathrus columnatus]